jgi:uncharacterized protein YutE (UPF0331/DUF86 family)
MIDRVLLSKARSIERCVDRVREEYVGHEDDFATNWTRQDATVLNLIRACEQAIDMANRAAYLRALEIADDTAETFVVLAKAGLIPPDLAQSMKCMVGFRNVAVHEYQELDLAKVRHIIERRLDDLLAFSKAMLQADPSG